MFLVLFYNISSFIPQLKTIDNELTGRCKPANRTVSTVATGLPSATCPVKQL